MGITAAQARARKTQHTETVKIILNDEWGRKLAQLQERADLIQRDVSLGRRDTSLIEQLDEVNAEIEAVLEEAKDEVLEVVFVGLSPDRYDRLIRAHPPTKEQRTEAAKEGRTLSWNTETFPQDLVAACWRSPDGWSREDIVELWDSGEEGHEDDDEAPAGSKWNSSELGALFLGAQGACMSRNRVQ